MNMSMNEMSLFRFFFFFGLMLNVPVNNYGHVGMLRSPYHTFSWASLTKQLTSKLVLPVHTVISLLQARHLLESLLFTEMGWASIRGYKWEKSL